MLEELESPFDFDDPGADIDSVTVFITAAAPAWSCSTMTCLGTSISTSLATSLFLSYSVRTLKPTWYLWLPYCTTWVEVVAILG
jgi:hypothetical protein